MRLFRQGPSFLGSDDRLVTQHRLLPLDRAASKYVGPIHKIVVIVRCPTIKGVTAKMNMSIKIELNIKMVALSPALLSSSKALCEQSILEIATIIEPCSLLFYTFPSYTMP